MGSFPGFKDGRLGGGKAEESVIVSPNRQLEK